VRYYLLFIDLAEKPVLFSGAGWHAGAKIRLWLRTEARMEVYSDSACDDVLDWAQDGRLVHVQMSDWVICEAAGLAEGLKSRPATYFLEKVFCRLIVGCRAFPS
jgi:siroheme synthase (precorrin-2 oxidase/ferrochelatase)